MQFSHGLVGLDAPRETERPHIVKGPSKPSQSEFIARALRSHIGLPESAIAEAWRGLPDVGYQASHADSAIAYLQTTERERGRTMILVDERTHVLEGGVHDEITNSRFATTLPPSTSSGTRGLTGLD